MGDETLTTKQTAERLGISVGRVRQLVLTGDLPAEKFGRDLMIKAADLDKITIHRKPGRPPLTDEEKAARADRRASEPPAATKLKAKARKAVKRATKKGSAK